MADIGQEFCFLGFITLFSFTVDLEKIFSANIGESRIAIRRKKVKSVTLKWKTIQFKNLVGFFYFQRNAQIHYDLVNFHLVVRASRWIYSRDIKSRRYDWIRRCRLFHTVLMTPWIRIGSANMKHVCRSGWVALSIATRIISCTHRVVIEAISPLKISLKSKIKKACVHPDSIVNLYKKMHQHLNDLRWLTRVWLSKILVILINLFFIRTCRFVFRLDFHY